MLSNVKNLFRLTSQIIRKCEFQSSCKNTELLSSVGCDNCSKIQRQSFHLDTPRMLDRVALEKRKAALHEARNEGKVDVIYSINENEKRKQGHFPMGDISDVIINGRAFKDIPVVFIQSTKNNTIMSLSDQGVCKLIRSCGTEGFKNTRKGTNVAAQTLGYSFGFRAIKRGFKDIRVIIRGLGPGRLSGVKGLQLGGMNIISITDATADYTSIRPRKQRRV